MAKHITIISTYRVNGRSLLKALGSVGVTAVLLALFTSCVQFKEATLYSGEMRKALPPKPERISSVVEPVLFKNATADVWGLEKDDCKEIGLSKDVYYVGSQSIKVVWDRETGNCIWAGFGIGWDGWAGKDLSALMDHAAFSFYVRTVEGKSFGLPFVLTLEDYSGGMGFCYTANKYFERTSIDETWQRVVVPLADFDIATEKLDVTNIKQLQIELQQSGAVYVDNLELVFFTPEPQEPWLEEEERPDPVDLPVALFEDDFINNNGWGLTKDNCKDFRRSTDEAAVGEKSIYAKWNANAENCHLMKFGVSWNRWFPTDVTSIQKKGAIQFQIKMISSPRNENISINVGFEDYDRATTSVLVQNAYSATGRYAPQWTTVTVPLAQLPDNIDFKQVKHMYFEFLDQGECYIDDIRLVNMASTAP